MLLLAACGRPSETDAPATASGNNLLPPLPTPTLASSNTPTASPVLPTPTPTWTPEPCRFDASLVAGVTVPNDTVLEAGAVFEKSWRLLNNGTCAWDEAVAWTFDGGHAMNGPLATLVPPTAPGQNAEISLVLVAPAAPGTYEGFWRMEAPSGERFGERLQVRIAVQEPPAAPTRPATATPTSTAPAVLLAIHEFRATPSIADPGDAVLLSWQSSGALTLTLYHLLPSGQLGMPYWKVAPQGSLTVTIGANERNSSGFVLFANDESSTVQATVSITLRCPDSWFFSSPPDICPAAPPLLSAAAEQSFEHGSMVWVAEWGVIYVLYGDGASPAWKPYADTWQEGDPIDDPALEAPPGLRQPIRGFGLLWRSEQGVRDRLGWATASEAAFQTAIQATSRFKYNDLYLRALDGDIYLLLTEGSGWRKIAP
jgi:hypothetical protein